MSTPSWKKKLLPSAMPRAWSLEARLMFDAAAAADAVQVLSEAAPASEAQRDAAPAAAPLPLPETPVTVQAFEMLRPAPGGAPLPPLVLEAQVQAQRLLEEFLSQPDAIERLFELFDGGQGEPSAQWRQAADAFLAALRTGEAAIDVELRTHAELQGALGAFAAQGPSGGPVIFLNAGWIDYWSASGAPAEALTRVLLEEFGHGIDAALNGAVDTQGDEGEAFAAAVMRLELDPAERLRIAHEDDRGVLVIDGRAYAVEEASLTFTQVFQITPTSRSEEANGFTTAAAAVAGTNFRFTSSDPSDPLFKGNNVTGSLSYEDAGGQRQTLYGVVSRLVKTGSTVNGLYFYVPGADGQISTGDDTAYVLRLNPAFSFAGSTAYGTSSDPVDTAMNRYIVPNRAPVAANDSATVLEDGSVAGNVLANDSDADLDALRLTAFTVAGSTHAVADGASVETGLPGVGTLRVGSDGSYLFTPAPDYSGPVPLVSYTVSDGRASATATLSLFIVPVNDAPSGADRTLTTAEDTPYRFAAADFGFADTRDNGAHTLAGVVITTLPTAGTLRFDGVPVQAGQQIAAADLARLEFTPAADAHGNAYASFTFQVRDSGGTAHGGADLDPVPRVLTFNVTPVNDTPTARPDTGEAREAGGTANATAGANASGNVLANDSDVDARDTLKVRAVASATLGGTVVPADGSTAANQAAVLAGLYGTLRIGADGSYVYEVDNTHAAVQALRGDTDTLTEVFRYTVADAAGATSGSTLTITIRSANDAPVAVNDFNTAKEAGPNPATYPGSDAAGNVLANDRDVDAGDTRTVVELVAGATAASTVTNDPTRIVVTSLGNTSSSQPKDYANVGDVLHVTLNGSTLYDKNNISNRITVTAVDPVTRVVTLSTTVNIASNATIEFWEPNPGSQISGNSYFSTTGQSAPGTTSSSTLTLSARSGTVLVGMTVHGTGNATAPTVTAVDHVNSRITLSAPVTLMSSTSLSFSLAPGANIQGQRGTLSLGADGDYVYRITDHSLAAGQTFDETFTYRMRDAGGLTSTAVLTVRIEGTSNDTEPDARADSATAIEAGGVANGTPGTDPGGNVLSGDIGSNLAVTAVWSERTPVSSTVGVGISGATVVNGYYGSLSIAADGSYQYALDNTLAQVQALNSGDTLKDVFFYRAANGSGSDVALLTVTIQGSNDAPVALADTASAAAAGGTAAGQDAVGNVLHNDRDADAGDALTVAWVGLGLAAPGTAVAPGSSAAGGGTSVAGSYGTLVLGADGSYRYAIDAGNAAVRALAAGASLSETFSYTVRDAGGLESTAALTVTVEGANDAPVNTAPSSHTQFDHENALIPGLSVADVDGNLARVALTVRSGTLSVDAAQAGTATLAGTGTPDSPLLISGSQAEINALLATLRYRAAEGFAGSDLLTLQSFDSSGLQDSDSVAITVSPDARPLVVSSPSVNEASPHIVFTVSGAAGQRVSLTLGSTGSGPGHAESGLDFSPNLEIHDGVAWVPYAGIVALPGSGTLLVRTTVLQDSVHEGAETLRLAAINAAGVAAFGTGTIQDDGTGDIYADNGTPLPPGPRDDDRPLAVTDITVNEASPWAVFKVTGAAGQALSLALSNGSADDADRGSAIEVFDAGADNGKGAWITYAAELMLPSDGELLVRTSITPDSVYEGPETFGLVATNTGGGSAVGIAVIVDDGTGDVYRDDSGIDPSAVKDDDRALTVSSPTVNEASPWAVFTVSGVAGQRVSLALADGSALGSG
ncbi:VCBS domain-containing protein, partial [Caldimonas tepidiphila]|uniref:VCBS domain-containing protein n=1 Tax=Caldimonas tepidiphila TaxID=2315841 RepID=UPI00130074A2